jgi:hypothetical protein
MGIGHQELPRVERIVDLFGRRQEHLSRRAGFSDLLIADGLTHGVNVGQEFLCRRCRRAVLSRLYETRALRRPVSVKSE